jgi:peroxiredoxin Q/BCP
LRRDYDQFVARNVEILVIGPEKAATFERYWKKEDLSFTGLPDPRHSVIKLYGQEVKLFKLGRMPAQILVDKAGIARYVHYGEDMKDILTNAQILALVDELNAEAPQG